MSEHESAGSSWLRTLARLWCLRPVAAPPRGNPVVATGLLGVACLALWVAIDRWQRQPQPHFSVDGIPLLGWYAVGILAVAALLRRIAAAPPPFGTILVLAMGAVPLPLVLLGVAAPYLSVAGFWCAAVAVLLHLWVYFMRGLRALTGRPQWVAAIAGVLFATAFIGASDALDAIPDLWTPREADSGKSDDAVAAQETALFEQAARIDAALAAIHRDKTTAAQAFFLGFAGVGDEKVFAQEIALASRVLGERYRFGERRLSLVNDERDLDHAPLASVSGLDRALKGLASRMDVEHDVLFLAISSHGAEDPAIAVSNFQFPLIDLTPADLADSLRESAIRWRVIIISACYAGGFIDALRDPRSIVVTAAAADRTSFGCSNDRDLTYFGEAFYRDALPNAVSLRDAFEAAKKSLAGRESREHETPSNPQAYFGAAMEAKLAAMSAAMAH
jgi:Peptidase C13 family